MEAKQKPSTEADAIAALGVAAAQTPVIVKTDKGREYLVTPEGYAAKDVTEANAVDPLAPKFIGQAVVLQTLDSLSEYVEVFKTDATMLFADIASDTIRAAIDYHGSTTPGTLAHVATLTLPYSVEFKVWSAVDGKLMSQLDFARFLEENAADITAPAGADLLEACRDLQAKRKVDFRKAVRTSSDNENFEFSDETNLTQKNGAIEVPTKFTLSIPIYFGDGPVTVGAFLRWRLDEGQLHLGIALHRAEHVRQAVFKQHVLTVADRTDRKAVFGKLA